jgi:hypothetical protein
LYRRIYAFALAAVSTEERRVGDGGFRFPENRSDECGTPALSAGVFALAIVSRYDV